MGTTGPAPKRDAERRRRNAKTVPTTTVVIDDLIKEPVEIPEADPSWHATARHWYDSLQRSGQAVFYEPSDWATALVLAETLSRELNPQFVAYVDKESGETIAEWVTMPIKGSSLTAILKGMTALMVTEGDRRRLSIELERKRATDEATAALKGAASISAQRDKRFARES
jgi:hypothetical protein